MKVGLVAEVGSPDVGGGYRFQSEVAMALLATPRMRHEFCPLIDSDVAANVWRDRAATSIDVRRGFAERGAQRLRRLVSDGAARRMRQGGWGDWWSGSHSFEPFFHRTLENHGIGALLSLHPGHVPVMSVPFVTVVWDVQHRLQPIFPEVSSNGEWETRETRYRTILPRASAILTGTETGRSEIQRFYGVAPESIFVLPMPTPEFARRARTESSQAAARRPSDLPSRYLLYPAQFWPHKNHVVLLRALKLLRERGAPDVRLVFVGSDKGSRAHVQRVADELGVSRFVTLEGFVDQRRLVDLYRHAEALVFPSFFGPDNLPPLEAFAIGTPVIAARVPGAEDQLVDAALLVDARAPAEWADAVCRIVNDASLRRSLVEKGIARSETRTLSHYVEGLCAVFDRIEPVRQCWPL